MKKLLIHLVKYINHFTNERVTAETEAKQILQYMLLKNSTVHSIEIFESLESQFKAEMIRRQEEAYKICRAVNEKYKPQPIKPQVYDFNFDKPLSEINVDFAEVKAS